MVFSPNGDTLPIDIANKTVAELKSMGFKDIVSFELRRDSKTKAMKPYMNDEEKLKLQ
jgi:hypothetical protein